MNIIGIEGLVIPKIAKVDKVRDNKSFFAMGHEMLRESGIKDYQFYVHTGGDSTHIIEDDDLETLNHKREQLLQDIEAYYVSKTKD